MAQVCASCAAESPETAKFCVGCGTPLARRCPSCGHPAVPGRFCAECGSPLDAAAAPPPPAPVATGPVSERRTTTVLFADLVSFTTLAEGRDPEEVRELLSTYFVVARTVVGRYGGTVEKFIGDAVMAVWGVPVSHEDDAERAVRAGLDLVTEVAALGSSVAVPGLALRVGIVTGSVAVTLGAVGEGMVAGDAVNTAARVQATAEPGSVWVDHETRGLAAAAVSFNDRGEHALKGKAEPVRLHRAEAVVAAVGGVQRVDGLEAPMVGRDAELRTVKEALHATQADGRARLVVVTGEAGVGKSRLGWEFEKYADGITEGLAWHRGRCLSYGEGVAFWAFAEMVRSRLGVLEGDGRPEMDAKVRSGVDAVARDAAEAAWLVPRVGALVSGGDHTITFDRTDLFAAWATFLERVSAGRPVVLLFEDTQYADSGLLDLVEHLLKAIRCPLLVLVFGRPELLERRPGLATGRSTTWVELGPLGDAAMRALVDGLVDDLPARARTALVARSEGVPLYAVETVRSLIDQDAVVAREGRYVFVDHDHTRVDLARLSAPTSLQTLIAARLDTLTPLERRTVQDASVLGMTFRYASLLAVSEVSSHDLDAALATLVEKGLLETQNDPRSPEVGQFRFLQAMVREVAYQTLARVDRRARHLAAAAQLEREGEEVAGIVAQHLLDALAASTDHDPDRHMMAERARGLLTTAAGRAEAIGAPEKALAAVLAALELGPEPGERTGLLERAARVATLAGLAEQGEDLARQAVAGYEVDNDAAGMARSLVVQAQAQMNLGRNADAGTTAERGVALAATGAVVSPDAHIELLALLAWVARVTGDREAQREHAMRAMVLAEELRDPNWVVRALNTLATMLVDHGMPTANLAIIERSMQLARQEHLLDQLGRSLTNMCANRYAEDLTGIFELTDEALAVERQLGDLQGVEVVMANAVFIWWFAGRWDRLLEETEEWHDREPTATCSPLWLGRALVQTARGEPIDAPVLPDTEEHFFAQAAEVVQALRLLAAGEGAEAARGADQASRHHYAAHLNAEDFEAMWAPTVELQLAAGDLEAAAGLLDLADVHVGARPTALALGVVPRLRGLLALARDEDPETHLRSAEAALEAYGAPYLLARTRLELGRWLHGQGRVEEATTLLAQARPVFEGLGAAPSVAEVDAVLSPSPLTVV